MCIRDRLRRAPQSPRELRSAPGQLQRVLEISGELPKSLRISARDWAITYRYPRVARIAKWR
eukprot:7947561-Alexandrium_andersonii.AAC.1